MIPGHTSIKSDFTELKSCTNSRFVNNRNQEAESQKEKPPKVGKNEWWAEYIEQLPQAYTFHYKDTMEFNGYTSRDNSHRND